MKNCDTQHDKDLPLEQGNVKPVERSTSGLHFNYLVEADTKSFRCDLETDPKQETN